MSVVPGTRPLTEGEWARSVEQRLRQFQNRTTVRIGQWVITEIGGQLTAVKPGDEFELGAAQPTTVDLTRSLRGFVTQDDLDEAQGETEQSIWEQLWEQLTGESDPGEDVLSQLANFLTSGLFGQIDISRLPSLLPLSRIRDIVQNLFLNGDFKTLDSIAPGIDDWFVDLSDGIGGRGSAWTIADGNTHILFSNNIDLDPDSEQTLSLSTFVRYMDLASTGESIKLQLSKYLGNDLVGTEVIDSLTGPTGTLATWVQELSGTWTSPGDGTVDNVVTELVVANTATSGTVKFTKALSTFTDLLPQGYVSGLLTAISSIWSGIAARIADWQALLDVFNNGPGGILNDVEDRIQHLAAGTGLFDSSKLAGLLDFDQVDGLPTLAAVSNQIRDILAGLIVTPINSTVQDIKDWFNGILDRTQNLDSSGQIDKTQVIGLPAIESAVGGAVSDAADALAQGSNIIKGIFNKWFDTDTATGITAEVEEAVEAIRLAVVNGYIIETFTSSDTWYSSAGITELWFICIGGGGRGFNGQGVTTSGSPVTGVGGVGGQSGGFIAEQLDPADYPDGTPVTVTVGAAASTPGANGGNTSIGPVSSSPGSGGIASPVGYGETTSIPGNGGNGGNGTHNGSSTVGTTVATAGTASAKGTAGSAGSGNSGSGSRTGGTGGAGGNVSLTLPTKCGGGGGGGGGGAATSGGFTSANGGPGGNGGYPGGGSGGGGGAASPNTSSANGGAAGTPGNGVAFIMRKGGSI